MACGVQVGASPPQLRASSCLRASVPPFGGNWLPPAIRWPRVSPLPCCVGAALEPGGAECFRGGGKALVHSFQSCPQRKDSSSLKFTDSGAENLSPDLHLCGQT